jgi:hypothetical protein
MFLIDVLKCVYGKREEQKFEEDKVIARYKNKEV